MTVETANRLMEFRKKAGLSQEELADKLGVSRQAVSKWERSEASPDTDNLISLAKLYGVSLDELIGNEPKNSLKEDSKGDTKRKVNIGPGRIDVVSDGEEVHVGFDGNHVENEEGRVYINRGYFKGKPSKTRAFFLALEASFAILVTTAYIVMGICYKGTLGTAGVTSWAGLWPAFILIPVVSSLKTAIEKRKVCDFAYPVLITAIYCFLGMLMNLWHPLWVLFLTIPVFYTFFGIIDHKSHINNIDTIVVNDDEENDD